MFAESGAASLAYDVIGDRGDGVDALLIHAGVTDRRSWAPLTGALAVRHRCVSFDQRGYGESTWRAEPFSRSADARTVMDAAGVRRAAVVAASMGGRAAIDLALQHPDRVAALVLIGAAVSGAPESDELGPDIATLLPLVEAAEAAGDTAELNRLEAWLWLDGPTAPEGRVGGRARDLFLDMNARALAAPDLGPADDSVDAWARLGEIAVPALILVGELDLVELQQRSEVLAERIPDARFVRLPGVAHLPHLEADAACLREITAFLDALPG